MSLLFSYYGDDFTGSTDALEALSAHGLSTVLFLGVPTSNHYQQFKDYQALGIAGDSRSRSPEWMKQALPAIFTWLRNLNAPITQYKVCSTFDSSLQTGNISVAMQAGREVFGTGCVFVVAAAPHLRRYVLFGNLFAGAGGGIYRIDRHPTMCQHPVTPMGESDLRLHLQQQGERSPELLDILALSQADPNESLDRLLTVSPSAVIFDGLNHCSEFATGALLWSRRNQHRFTVGSSGLTRCLIAHWREVGLLPNEISRPKPTAVDRLIVVSGSCSPVTEGQIKCAIGLGFQDFHTANLGNDELLRRALQSLAEGKSIVIYSALGPNNQQGLLTGEHLGHSLGTLLRDLVRKSGVRRVIVAGGDTASHAMRQLNIHALTFAAPLAPGAPLCRAHSDETALEGLELVLKGGQIGADNFFDQVRTGQI